MTHIALQNEWYRGIFKKESERKRLLTHVHTHEDKGDNINKYLSEGNSLMFSFNQILSVTFKMVNRI